jgi:RNA polymerase sigma factor (sigma-70 family)
MISPSAEREFVLAAKNDPAKQGQLIAAFMPLITDIAQNYRGASAAEPTELLQSGTAGLLRALRRYEPSLGAPFWAYAAWWVRQAMQQVTAERSRPIARPAEPRRRGRLPVCPDPAAHPRGARGR